LEELEKHLKNLELEKRDLADQMATCEQVRLEAAEEHKSEMHALFYAVQPA
jgi:hypothetical protein